MEELMKKDLYGEFGVSPSATQKEIISSYRKLARKCHPDKNPDNPKAAEEFHKLSQALEILTDAAARAAYDKVVKSRHAAAQRTRALDDKRRKFKEDLEAREGAARDDTWQRERAASNLRAEVDRLRRQGSSLLEQEQERMRNEMRQATSDVTAQVEEVAAKLKIRWMASKGDEDNGGYNQQNLMDILQKYGEVSVLLVSSKKRGSAIVEFVAGRHAENAVLYEQGLASNPLSFTWLSGQPQAARTFTCQATANQQPQSKWESQQSLVSDDDFESLVLRKMRQAEERKRLEQQILVEDELNERTGAQGGGAQGSGAPGDVSDEPKGVVPCEATLQTENANSAATFVDLT